MTEKNRYTFYNSYKFQHKYLSLHKYGLKKVSLWLSMSPPRDFSMGSISLPRTRLRKTGWWRVAKAKVHHTATRASKAFQSHRRPSGIDIAHVPIIAEIRRRRRCRANRGRFKPHTWIHEPWEPNCETLTVAGQVKEPDRSVVGRLADEVKGQRASRFCIEALSFFGAARAIKMKRRNARSEQITGRSPTKVMAIFLLLLLNVSVKKMSSSSINKSALCNLW